MSKFITRGLVLVLALVLCMGLIVTASAETDILAGKDGVWGAYAPMSKVVTHHITVDSAKGQVTIEGLSDSSLDGVYTYEATGKDAYLIDATGTKTKAYLRVTDTGLMSYLPGGFSATKMDFLGELPEEKPEEPKDEGLKLGENAINVPAGYDGTKVTFTVPESGDYILAAAEGETNAYVIWDFGWSSETLELPFTFEYTMAGDEIDLIVSSDNLQADEINLVITKKGAEEEKPEEPKVPTWTKVEFDAVDWSGTYLIVWEEGNYAFDGSLEKYDVAPNSFEVEIVNGVITGDLADKAFTIIPVEGGYAILGGGGKYVGRESGNANKNGINTSGNQDAFLNTIEYDAEQGILIKNPDGNAMRFNNQSSELRFRFFKAASYTNQKPIALYRLEDGTQLEQKPAEEPKPADLVVGENKIDVVADSTTHLVYTVTEAGTYVFAPVTGETNAAVMVEYNNYSNMDIMYDEAIEVELTAGETINVYVGTNDCAADTVEFTFGKKTAEEEKPEEKPEEPVGPEAGNYIWGMLQANEEVNKELFFAGATANKDYYLATTDNKAEATVVTVEKVEGGYRLYFMDGEKKMYIDIYKNGNYVNIRLTEEPTAVFTWNAEYKTFVTDIEGTPYYMGTYNTYTTISASKLEYIATSYPTQLYAVAEKPTEPAPTGDNSGIVMLMVVMTISMGAVLVLGKKAVR